MNFWQLFTLYSCFWAGEEIINVACNTFAGWSKQAHQYDPWGTGKGDYTSLSWSG